MLTRSQYKKSIGIYAAVSIATILICYLSGSMTPLQIWDSWVTQTIGFVQGWMFFVLIYEVKK